MACGWLVMFGRNKKKNTCCVSLDYWIEEFLSRFVLVVSLFFKGVKNTSGVCVCSAEMTCL